MYLSLRFDFEAISSTEEGGNRPIISQILVLRPIDTMSDGFRIIIHLVLISWVIIIIFFDNPEKSNIPSSS